MPQDFKRGNSPGTSNRGASQPPGHGARPGYPPPGNYPPPGYPPPPGNPPVPNYGGGHNTGQFGNLIIYGDGKTANAWWIWLLIGIGGAIVSFILASTLGFTRVIGFWGVGITTRNPFFYIFIVIGLWEILEGILQAYGIYNSRIAVYEKAIVGKGVSKWYWLGDFRTFDFVYSHDQVTVGVESERLDVQTYGTHYKVFTKNAAAIQNAAYNMHMQMNMRK